MSKAKAPRALLAERVARSASNERQQTLATKRARWSEAADKAFIDTLAATCNVRAAAAAAGFSTEACYKQRARRPAFAADWALALEQGYERLETMLIEMMMTETTMITTRENQVMGRVSGAKGGRGKRRSGKPLPYAEIVKLLRMHFTSVRGAGAQRYS